MLSIISNEYWLPNQTGRFCSTTKKVTATVVAICAGKADKLVLGNLDFTPLGSCQGLCEGYVDDVAGVQTRTRRLCGEVNL